MWQECSNFVRMKRSRHTALLSALLLATACPAHEAFPRQAEHEPSMPVHATRGDTIARVQLPTLYVFEPLQFKNKRQQRRYNKLVRDVKKVLPLSKEIRGIIIETYELLQTLPTDKARQEHIRRVEKGLKKQYTPRLKKLTYSQGKLLIKLVDRETNQTSYELVRAFMGPFKAGFYQTFAALFGASLKKEYHSIKAGVFCSDWKIDVILYYYADFLEKKEAVLTAENSTEEYALFPAQYMETLCHYQDSRLEDVAVLVWYVPEKADTYIAEDTETQNKWGLLQYYDQVDENMNAAQIEQMCLQYLQYYNRVVQELSVDALGVVGIRAGMIIPMRISAVDSLSVSRLMLAEKVTHSFKGGEHTMSIDVKDFQNLGGDLSIV